ncbi:MAG: hypothetical protein R3C14_53315 [Caldilineaceae bacterium]
MTREVFIEVKEELSNTGLAILRRYLADAIRLTEAEWRQLRAVIHQLSQSEVNFDGRRYTFRRFYATFINGTYARPFLRQIQTMEQLQTEGSALQAAMARKIVTWLISSGLAPTQISHADLLLVYCLYWWASFARGYLFEQVIIRDLRASKVHFEAHEVTYGQERYTQFDLQIAGMGMGDIKASLYFLDDFPEPPADFYIMQLFDDNQRRLRQIVFLLPVHWEQIDGEPQTATIKDAPSIFPRPVVLKISGKEWIVAAYEVWKERLLRWQQQGDSDE